jgi:hypothetical protein
VILRAFLALLAGFATMAAIVVVVTAVFGRLTPDWVGTERKPNPGYVFVNLGYSFLAAAAGGFVTAWIAAANPMANILGLAVVVLALGAVSALQARGKQPVWYVMALLVISPVGVVAGGLVRLRVTGIL